MYIGTTYHAFHATLAKGDKAHLEAEAAMALNKSEDNASPPIHVKACCYGSANEKGNGFTKAICVNQDQTPMCILVVAAT